MAYRKLTKKQRKDRDRILAWLEGKEFRENSRAKPVIPDLSIGEVLEFYVPPDVTGAGQFFTPLEMSRKLLSYMDYPRFNGNGVKILDPCAGIGHLLFPLADRTIGWELVAYEIEEECVKIGKRLFPQVQWNWEIPFDFVEKLECQFDYVVMNPPFNTRRGIYPGQEMCQGRCSKSEHVFLELAIRACKPGGQIGVIAPYNYCDRFPKELRRWLEGRAEMVCDLGELPGEFALSSISVHGFIFKRLGELESEKESVPEQKRDWQEEWSKAPLLAGDGRPKQVIQQLSLF